MQLVIIHGWQEASSELVQALADGLGILVFEARQRLIGGGPAGVAGFADSQRALDLAEQLKQRGFTTLVIDTAAVSGKAFAVRRFDLHADTLHLEASDGQMVEFAYNEIELLLPARSFTGQTETKTVTERKFSIGKTLLAGGIPMTKKVERQEEVTSQERRNLLYLYAGQRPLILFSQNDLSYNGLGAAMQLTGDLNFAYLIAELRRRSSQARFDERLLQQNGQLRLLGPAQNLGVNLDLAAEILARALLPGRG